METEEYGKPDPNRLTTKLFAEYDALHEKQQNGMDEKKTMELLEPSEVFEIYSPATMEIISIAKEEGDILSDQSLKFLNEALRYTVVPRGYSPQGVDARTTVKNVATITKDLVDIGKIVFEKFPKYLQFFGPFGSLLKDILDMTKPEKKDPVLEELGNLKSQLESLSQKMVVQFDELKAFMVEKDFYNNYAHKASLLFDYMIDCVATIDTKTKERFEECYNEIKPERYVRDMLIKLESDVTNPLKVSMAGDELTSKATFQKWKDVLNSTLSQFLLLECFAMGFLHPKDESDSKKIIEKITYYTTLVEQWEKHYLNDRPYWPKLKKYVERIQGEGSFDKDEDMATELKKGLDSILTEDNFYLYVFEKNVHYEIHVVKPEMVFVSTNRGKFSVIISRAFEHSEYTCGQYWKKLDNIMYRRIERSIWYALETHMKEFVQWAVASYAKNDFKGCSYFLAFSSRNVAVRWTRKHGAEKGPGFINWDGQLTVFNVTTGTWNMLYMVGE
ncbi:B30.2/SPRY domain-containing protein [Caenorhabditis elegans]|nr:B30.2/SPRY domain-containing protein [Caenorhabditis elegans]NP_493887.1 B30.2/SPRY domain-containing protein [Caenorhabditis elegans]CCD66369.1 B30.2/SPRY domain-containing protein [Caenorhabditis elegans]CCD66370.1 B30.2/SPRY domain-containing protein [Caenorhabditis elegans]|eukprot:NP_493885.1 Uncharacterized protein CELE_F45D11.15 [Caenorhabditis elegans]